jgi:starvation-inducible DNA-binding protein
MKRQFTQTRGSLPQKVRIEVATQLQERLADSIDLMMQAKQAHWNVKGANFIVLHELFDKVYVDTGAYVDVIAERIVQLGGVALGTVREAAKKSRLPEYPLDISSGKFHVAELAHAIAFYGGLIRKASEQCIKIGDADSADLFIEISRGADKNLWFVEAHEQAGH